MKRSLKILIVAGIALGAAILVPIIHHYQLRAATEAYITQLKAQGEPMDLVQVLPPSVPPEQNSADNFRKAVALFEADQGFLGTNYGVDCMRMVALGKAMICSRQPEVHNYNSTNPWDVVKTAVAQNKEAFMLVQQIVARPNFDFQITYDQGDAGLIFTNFYLAESKRTIQRLETAVLCDLHQGDTALAVTNLQAMLAIVKAMRNERLVISELVRIAMASIALTANWEVLQSTNLTDEQLSRLQNNWASLDFVRGEESALEMERVTGGITLKKLRSSNAEWRKTIDLGRKALETMGVPNEDENLWDKAKLEIDIFMWRGWWSYPDELRALKGYEVLINTVRLVSTNDSFQMALLNQGTNLDQLGISKMDSSLDSLSSGEMDFHSVLSESIVSLAGVARKVMGMETAKQMVVTSIALKRYQLKYGNYPMNLSALVPEFLPSVPLDSVDGQPLRYRRNADGTFLLYSVGENGKDDGGNPALKEDAQFPSRYSYWQHRDALDWVWPQPATPEEIQHYYAHPPK